MIRRLLLSALIAALPCAALAQGASPSGKFTPGHALKAQTPSGTPYSDAGGAAGGPPGTGLSELGITATGSPFCITDAATTAIGGYHQLCLGANALGGGLLSYNAYKGASALGLMVNVNGTSYSFPGTGNGNAVMPTSPAIVAHDLVMANGGTTLADSGILVSNGGVKISSTLTSGTTVTPNCGDAGQPVGAWYSQNCVQLSVTGPVSGAGQFGPAGFSVYQANASSGGAALMAWQEVPGTVTSGSGATIGIETTSAASNSYIYGLGSVYCVVRYTGWNCAGGEVDIQAYAALNNKVGWNIVDAFDQYQGSVVDAALVIDSSGRVSPPYPPGWKYAILVGGYNETNNTPLSAGGALFETFTGVPTALTTAFDISGTATVSGIGGAGFTYTGYFFYANTNSHWSGAGVFVSTGTGGSHDFVRTDGGYSLAVESSTGNVYLAVNNRTTGSQATTRYQDAGISKWEVGKNADNSFMVYDDATSKFVLTVGASSAAGQTVLGESGGSVLTLAAAGGTTLTNLATSAGSGGLYVCADNSGVLYRKSACP